MVPWKYYVYQFFQHGICVYVGKGSNGRFQLQRRRFKDCSGHIVAYFATEDDALIHENRLISELTPAFNKKLMPKCAEPWLKVLLPEKDLDFYSWCEVLGPRQMAARVLLSKDWDCLRAYGVDVGELLSKLNPMCESMEIKKPQSMTGA